MTEKNAGAGEQVAAGAAETQQADDELWNQVQTDRATQAGEEQAQAPAGNGADQRAGLPAPTKKLLDEIDRLNTVVKEQGSNLEAVSRQMSAVNGTFGTLKQRLDASQVVIDKVAPTIEAAEAAKKEEERKKAEEKAARRQELRDRIIDPDVLEYMDEVLGTDNKPAAATAADDKPDAGAKPDAAAQAPNTDEKIRVLTLQRELSDRVPGWLKIRETPEYKAFIAGPGKELFEANIDTWDPDVAAQVFTAFDKHKSDAAKVAQVEKDRQDRLRRGENPQGRKTTTGDGSLSSDDAWEKVKRDRAAAQASG